MQKCSTKSSLFDTLLWDNQQTLIDYSQKNNNSTPKQKKSYFIKVGSTISKLDVVETYNATSTENRLNNKHLSGFVETYDATSAENRLNNRRLFELEQNFSKQLISHILEDDFEYGMDYEAHIIVREQMKVNAVVTKNWINSIFVENYQNSEILIGILRIISRFEKEEIYPIGETIALASLSNKNEIVKENAIRAFESWGGLRSLKLLENVSVSSGWIKEYLYKVISDLKTEYVG